MQELICKDCYKVMCLGEDTDGDLMTLKVICICGKKNEFQFMGYPKLWGTHEIYFDFTDEDELTCHNR